MQAKAGAWKPHGAPAELPRNLLGAACDNKKATAWSPSGTALYTPEALYSLAAVLHQAVKLSGRLLISEVGLSGSGGGGGVRSLSTSTNAPSSSR